MSSHHEWVSRIIAQHDKDKPFAPENGRPLAFNPGDPVIYTNEAGLKFALTVSGHYKPPYPCGLYARGYRYTLDSGSPWMPVPETSLQLDPSRLPAAKGA